MPGSRIESAAGVDYIFTGLPIPFFNVAVLTGRQLSAAALAAHGARRHSSGRRTRERRGCSIVTHEALEPGVDAAAVLDGCGLAPLLPMTGMIAQAVSPADAVSGWPPARRTAGRRAAAAALIDVNSAAYGMDLSASRAGLRQPARSGPIMSRCSAAPTAPRPRARRC